MKFREIAFTVIPVSNLIQARSFYEEVLGLKPTSVFQKDAMGFIEYGIGAGTLAIGNGSPLFKPGSGGAAVALEAENFDDTIAALKQHGAKFALEPRETPVCQMAIISDPDGNYVMIHRRKSLVPAS